MMLLFTAILFLMLFASRTHAASNTNPEITESMQRCVDEKQVSGVVTLAAHQGNVVHFEAVGKRDIERDEPMKKDTLFRLASMTKPFTVVALMMLVDEGKLGVNDLLEKHLPSFRNLWLLERGDENARSLKRPSRPITIFDLLTHTSGIADVDRDLGLESISKTALVASQRPLKFDPGSKWQYSGLVGITVIGHILEHFFDMPYEDVIHEKILRPLGMSDTGFEATPEVIARLATGYQYDDIGNLAAASRPMPDFRPFAPSASLISSAEDIYTWTQCMLNGGELGGVRILSEASAREMEKNHTGDLEVGRTEGLGHGLGWRVVRSPSKGATSMLSPGSFGHGGAFGTHNCADPKTGMIYVLMIQQVGFQGGADKSSVREVFQESAASAILG